MANYIKSLTTPEAETYQIKEDPSIHYATCSTAAATADKTISLDGFVLETGSWIAVRFTTTNTAAVANLTLNVNSTGAKGIKYRNADLSSAGILAAGRTYLMVYDGTYWQISGDIADKLQTARTINVGTAVTGTATAFDGSANITIPVTGLKEAYLTWGGKDFTQSFSPLDAALEPRLGANRLEMCPGAGIKIERTTDGGTTWTEVPTSSISNAQRSTLFSSSSGYNVPVSATSTAGMGDNAAKYMMRITLDTGVANVYTNLLKFIFNVSTNGCANCYVKLRIRTAANVTAGNDTWLTWDKTNKSWSSSPTESNARCPIGGWSGYNVINIATFTTYGNNTSQYRNVQFIFGCTKNDSTSTGLSIINIQGYGGVAWNAPSNMARTGHLYSWNGTGAATFPSTVTATNFSGKLNGITITGTTDASYNLNDFLTEHPTIPTSTDTASTPPTLTDGGTFVAIDSVTRDSNGHVTKINTATYTLPTHTFTDTKVDQVLSTVNENHPLLLANPQTSNTTATVNGTSLRNNSIYANPNTGALFASKVYVSGAENQSSPPTGGLHIYDCRSGNVTPAHGNKSAFFYFHMTGTPDASKWWSILHVTGWTGAYSSWEIAGPSNNSNQNTTPLYVRTSNVNTAWGSWRQIYDSVNKPPDENVKQTLLAVDSAETSYRLILTPNTTTTTSGVNIIDSVKLNHTPGTTSNTGNDRIILGNSTVSGTAGNLEGIVRLYSPGTAHHTLKTAYTDTNITHTFPAATGTVLNTGTTSFTPTLTSGTKIGTITIDNVDTDIYCETNTNTDTKVSQRLVTSTNSYYPILASAETTSTTTETVTTTSIRNNSISINPLSGLINCFGRAIKCPSIQTGSSKVQHITLETLFTWLKDTKKYIPNNVYCHVVLATTWAYADNDILQINVSGTDYEIQLAGAIIEFMGTASAYNSGMFRFRIHTPPTMSFTPATGYTTFPVSHIAEYTCNGTAYAPVWKMILSKGDITAGTNNGQIKVSGTNITAYTHPSYTSKTSGLYKITVDATGHVSGTAAVEATDLPAHTHSDYVLKTGDTMSGDLTFAVSDGSDTPSIVFKRGNWTDSTVDWKIYNSSGALMMDRTVAGDTETWQNKFKVDGSGAYYGGSRLALASELVDTKVKQSQTTTADFRPVLFSANHSTDPESLEATTTDQSYVSKRIFAQPSTGNLFLYSTSGDSPALVFRRGTMTDANNDWKIYDSGDSLYFAQSAGGASSETWTNRVYINSTGLYVGSTAVSLEGHTHDYSKVSFTQNLSSGTKIGTITIDGTPTDLYCETNTNTDTKVNVTLATTTKAYLLGTSTLPTSSAQAVTSVADNGVYLDTTAGGLCATNVKASSTVCANTGNSNNAGGISLYGIDPETYGIMFRGTSNSGKHGYVQSDWATYFTMNQGATTRGWIFRKKTDGPVASISGAGNAVFNGSVTVGGNSANTSGCRMTYNSTTQTMDFVFA